MHEELTLRLHVRAKAGARRPGLSRSDNVVIVPSLQDPAKIAEKFPQGYVAVKPYLRVTPQPNLH